MKKKLRQTKTPSQFIGKNQMNLDDDAVAELLADKIYNPPISKEDFAVQLFIEALVIPKRVLVYNEHSMRDYIKLFMVTNSSE